MKRVAIIGSSSSGKTTLGKRLSEKLRIKHRELDSFFWEKGWKEADREVFQKRVEEFTSGSEWITDGNYTSYVSDLVWSRATTIIWLDYSLLVTLRQFFLRSVKRSFNKEELWNGNRETLWNSILSPNSLLIWILKTYKSNRKKFEDLKDSELYSHAEFIHLKNPQMTEEYLQKKVRAGK
ncbi:adenylate kinase [bacterium]|nr:adenylate kinase [bacterium]